LAAYHPILLPGWFSSLFGFVETNYDTVKSKLCVEQNEDGQKVLVSRDSGKRFLVGKFWTPPLSELREAATQNEEVAKLRQPNPALKLDFVYGDVSMLHAKDEYRHATFQAASQLRHL
jgi:hypothetical protein